MLAGIGADKATVNWVRPQSNKPVHKFLIQVNGVVGKHFFWRGCQGHVRSQKSREISDMHPATTTVGESPANQETAITITGLKPSHFYNVRVIAVGGNGFQAISQALRLRTFGRDGRPELGNSRLPANFDPDDHQPSSTQRENGDENGPPRSPIPGIESAPMPDAGLALTRDPGAATTVPRRNTLGRKPSPSVSSNDQRPARKDSTSADEIKELSDRFSSTKRELEETLALIDKEEEDHKKLMDELEQEKQQKKAEQKKKEEQTEKLKKEERLTERSMRSALQRKTQLEKQVKAKQAERSKYEDGIAKMTKQMEEWRKEMESFEEQKKAIEEDANKKMNKLRDAISQLQSGTSQLETELRARREQVQQLEDERKKLPGGEDDEAWRETDKEARHYWSRKEQESLMRLINEQKRTKQLDDSLASINAQLAQIPPAAFAMLDQANASNAEFDTPSQMPLKRRSHPSNSITNPTMSPAPQLPSLETLPQSIGFSATRNPPGFAAGPFGGLPAELDSMDEDGFRALSAGAPLSPSAHKFLPSNIFTDDEHDDPGSPASEAEPPSPFVPRQQTASSDRDPQSPASGRSASILSSPTASAQSLLYASLPNDDSERQSLHSRHDSNFASPLPATGQPAPNRLSSLLSFPRAKPSKATAEPPQLGSLKHGQSQSFPRQADDPDTGTSRRRTSLSTWGGRFMNRNSVGPDTMDTFTPQPANRGFSAKTLMPFGSRAAMHTVYDPDQTSPRPASIASSDVPRPSTDSGSLWPHQDQGGFIRPRPIWSGENHSWSRNPSRRPSIHGSTSALKTSLANVDDEILDQDALMDPQVSPSQVGVIGSRSTKKSLAKSLNPTAPGFSPFIGSLFGGKEKAKSKEKERAKDGNDEGPSSSYGNEPYTEQRSESRMSTSVQSRASISESHDSFCLDQSFSNTPSEPANGHKETQSPDNVVRKLFRKGSSSKFSLSSRLSKKTGPGSTTTVGSEKERRSSFCGSDDAMFGNGSSTAGDDMLGKSYDSVNSSPAIGSTKSKDGKTSGRWFSMGKKKETGQGEFGG